MACSLLLYSLPHAPLVHVMVLVTAAWLLDYGFMLTVHTCSTQGAAPQQLHVIVSRSCSCWLLWYDLSYGFTPPSSLTRTCTHTQVLQQGPAQVASRLTALKQALPEVDISLLVERLPQHFLAGDSAATCAQVSHVTHYAMCRRVNQQQCASCRSVCRCIVGSSSQQQQQGPTHTHGPVHPPPPALCPDPGPAVAAAAMPAEQVECAYATLRHGLPGADVAAMVQEDPALLFVELQSGEGPCAWHKQPQCRHHQPSAHNTVWLPQNMYSSGNPLPPPWLLRIP